ncbi:phosphotransferase family protein [Ktedonospora formicarum]|uniref:Aminoglycoside phosphotransferase domain-containing protein n=1 Tax=Ktedonospora formicarum TaxID=2778364 RepID=A0A8J3I765_9CHLR|nr:aminoglycoside phosphotransferase family protein [Ktedonospora formicarum]GHO48105.1 hypothetical protein KSX_62680 [Ktedonospora formicarum]
MPDLRPIVSQEQALAALSQHFAEPITDIEPLEGGQVMRTLAFRTGGSAYVAHFNRDNMLSSNLPKEALLLRKLASSPVPVAPTLHIGRLGALHYSIQPRIPGQMLENLKPWEQERFVPQIIDILDAIHHIDVSESSGYGVIDDQEQGMASSWHGFLRRIAGEDDEHDYYGKWHHLFDDTFLERDRFNDIYQRMCGLLAYCPEERYLVHGNYSTRNILADGDQITGVIDWVDARYGDFVYDITCLDFWNPWLNIREHFQNHYRQRGIEVPAFEQRLLCYECYTTLDGMRFFAKAGNEDAYRMVCQRFDAILNERASM